MNEELCIEARNITGQYFKEGYNCAESIFLAFKEYVDADDAILRIFTAFGGGHGRAGCTCGALMGAISIISLLTGRTSTNDEDKENCYSYSKEFHNRFVEQFKTSCCRALNTYDFDTREHAVNCLKITGKTGQMLMAYLLEKELLNL